jgi:ribosome-binding factor A
MSWRLVKINQLICQQLAEIIRQEIEFRANSLVSLTRVEATADLNQAKVYYHCYPEDYQEEVGKILQKKARWLHYLLCQRIKLKRVPQLTFIWQEEVYL